jgi:hypothetical protein
VAEVDYKERLRIKKKNIIPKEQVIINSVSSQPRSIYEIKRDLAIHGHSNQGSIKQLKTLFDRVGIIKVPIMCSPDRRGNKESWGWRYGLLKRIENDFEGEPDNCEYINRTSWYLKQTLEARFYRSLYQ